MRRRKQTKIVKEWRKLLKKIPLSERWDLRERVGICQMTAFSWWVSIPTEKRSDMKLLRQKIKQVLDAKSTDELYRASYEYEEGTTIQQGVLPIAQN
jgi:hypothetical protein